MLPTRLRRSKLARFGVLLSIVLPSGFAVATTASATSAPTASPRLVEKDGAYLAAASPGAPTTMASPSTPSTPLQDNRRGVSGRSARLDPGMVRVLALISIVVAAVAGLYVYRVIRRGL